MFMKYLDYTRMHISKNNKKINLKYTYGFDSFNLSFRRRTIKLRNVESGHSIILKLPNKGRLSINKINKLRAKFFVFRCLIKILKTNKIKNISKISKQDEIDIFKQ